MITIDKIQNTLSAHEPRLMPLDEKYRAAVAMVFHNHQDGLRMLFIERTKREGDPWSGHLAFPGGRMETEDEGPRHTAERETYEEIGFTLDAEAYVGRLDDLSAHIDPIKVSGFVYMVNEISSFALSEEVSEAFWMPLSALLDPNRQIQYPVQYQNAEHLVPAIDLLGSDRPVLWGLTYRFTTSFLGLMGIDLPPHEPLETRGE